jgi:hypothetical protein
LGKCHHHKKKGSNMTRLTKSQKAEQEQYREKLLQWLKPGDTVHTVLRHVSRSGMQRKIDLYKMDASDPLFLSGYAASVLENRWDRNGGGIIVGGCGMDMGFHLVYNLSYCLFPQGFECIGERCPSNDHSNGDQNYSPGHLHADGGYALRQRWI